MIEDVVIQKRLRDVLPIFAALASTLLTLSIAATLYLGRDILVPIALAVLLSFVLAPGVQFLQRIRVPRALAVIGVVLSAFIALLILGSVISAQVTRLAADVPRYRATMESKIQSVRGLTENTGALGRAIQIVQDLGQELQRSGHAQPSVAGPSERMASPPANAPLVVEMQDRDAGPLSAFFSLVSPLLGPLATTGLVLLFSVFMLIQREDLRNRFIRLVGASDLQKTTAAIDDAGRRLSRFLLFQLAINAVFGLVIGLGLWLIGIPGPVLWGIIGAVLRFVPYIGVVVAAAAPLALAVAIDPHWTMLLWCSVLFLAVEPVLGNVVEPMLYGHSTGLSPIAVILAATFWAFLWGPVGLVLSTPLTVCLVVLGRHIERLKFLDVVLGDRPALSPQQIFYQRMLAGDPSEAIDQAREFLKRRALSTFYDDVALESVRLAQEDIAHGLLTADRQETLRSSIGTLIEALSFVRRAPDRRRAVGSEAAAAVDLVGPDRAVASIVRRPDQLHPDWRGAVPILCIAGQSILDDNVALMLSNLFTRHGLRSRVVAPKLVTSDEPLPPEFADVAMVCFSYLDALSTLHMRYATRRLRRKTRGARIMVGLWRQRDPAMLEKLRRTIAADVLVTSLHDALAAALDLSELPRSPSPK